MDSHYSTYYWLLYLLFSTYYLLLTTYYLLPATYYSLLVTDYLLFTTYYLLLATHYFLLTTCYLLLTTCSLLATCYSLLVTYCSPLDTYYSLIASPFFLDLPRCPTLSPSAPLRPFLSYRPPHQVQYFERGAGNMHHLLPGAMPPSELIYHAGTPLSKEACYPVASPHTLC